LTPAGPTPDPRQVTLILIAVGGALGSVARYLVDGWVLDRVGATFPFGTLVVNLSGAFVLGLLSALTIDRSILPADIRAPVMIGFLGAYTTFSTLMLESWRLVESGEVVAGTVNVVGSAALGILAVLTGLTVGRLAA
jgi:fluoride exporter